MAPLMPQMSSARELGTRMFMPPLNGVMSGPDASSVRM
jgi:hypothetical protein